MAKRRLHLLWIAFDVVIVGIASAVAIDGALRVELFVALAICRKAAVAPNGLALQRQGGAVALEAIAWKRKRKIFIDAAAAYSYLSSYPIHPICSVHRVSHFSCKCPRDIVPSRRHNIRADRIRCGSHGKCSPWVAAGINAIVLKKIKSKRIFHFSHFTFHLPGIGHSRHRWRTVPRTWAYMWCYRSRDPMRIPQMCRSRTPRPPRWFCCHSFGATQSASDMDRHKSIFCFYSEQQIRFAIFNKNCTSIDFKLGKITQVL